MDAPRDFVGAVMKTLGLSFNASARDIEKCGVPRSVIMDRAAQLRRQARPPAIDVQKQIVCNPADAQTEAAT